MSPRRGKFDTKFIQFFWWLNLKFKSTLKKSPHKIFLIHERKQKLNNSHVF